MSNAGKIAIYFHRHRKLHPSSRAGGYKGGKSSKEGVVLVPVQEVLQANTPEAQGVNQFVWEAAEIIFKQRVRRGRQYEGNMRLYPAKRTLMAAAVVNDDPALNPLPSHMLTEQEHAKREEFVFAKLATVQFQNNEQAIAWNKKLYAGSCRLGLFGAECVCRKMWDGTVSHAADPMVRVPLVR